MPDERNRRSVVLRLRSAEELEEIKLHARALGIPANTFMCRAIEMAREAYPINEERRAAAAVAERLREEFMAGSMPRRKRGRPRKPKGTIPQPEDPGGVDELAVDTFKEGVEALHPHLDNRGKLIFDWLLEKFRVLMNNQRPSSSDRRKLSEFLRFFAEKKKLPAHGADYDDYDDLNIRDFLHALRMLYKETFKQRRKQEVKDFFQTMLGRLGLALKGEVNREERAGLSDWISDFRLRYPPGEALAGPQSPKG